MPLLSHPLGNSLHTNLPPMDRATLLGISVIGCLSVGVVGVIKGLFATSNNGGISLFAAAFSFGILAWLAWKTD